MLSALIAADKECTDQRDIMPDKALRPIGTVSKEWSECEHSTELPHWIYWKVDGYAEVFRGRRGSVLLYERCESVVGIEKEEYDGKIGAEK